MAFARGLLAQYNVTVLPGSLLARDAHGINPGEAGCAWRSSPMLDECLEAADRIVQFTRAYAAGNP